MPDHRARLLAEQLRVADRLLRDGFAREAEAAALQCLSENPECPAIYCLLGEIEESLGRQERAVIALKKAATLDPDNPVTWSRLGEIQALRARWREAEEAYRRASKLLPTSPIPLAALASTQLAAQRIEAALATGSTLLDRFPDSADALLMHGHLCKVMGEFESAAGAYERALKIAPDSSAAAYSLTDLQVPLPSDSRARAIERRLQCDDLPDSDRVNFEFALARIYEGAKQYELAFMHYTNAKEATRKSLNRRGLSYDFEGCEEKNKLIMLRYQTGSFQAKLPPLPIRLRPIFIVGMPRAGTTLVEQILSSHPLVSSAGEINAAPRCHELYLERCSQLGVERSSAPSAPGQADLLLEMRERYVEALFECGVESELVIDKLPGNFQLLGFIRIMFPDALIVHCRRAPISTCWSLYTSNFAAYAPYCAALENLAHYYRLYQELMAHWRTVLQPSMLEVQYENLVADPENVVRGLLSACDLPWDDQCLHFHKTARPVTTASVVQARQPIFTSSLQRWKPFEAYLSALKVLQ